MKSEGGGDGVVRVLARWGPLSCGLFECGGRWVLLGGGAPLVADSSPCCLSDPLLLPLPLRPCLDLVFRTLCRFLGISDCGRWPCAPLCRNCTALVTGSRAQRGGGGFGWRAAVGLGRGMVSVVRARCGRVWVAHRGRAGAWE